MNLLAFVARSARVSRRQALELSRGGLIEVNGSPPSAPRIDPLCDIVTLRGERLDLPEPVAYRLHKPLGVQVTMQQEKNNSKTEDGGRKTEKKDHGVGRGIVTFPDSFTCYAPGGATSFADGANPRALAAGIAGIARAFSMSEKTRQKRGDYDYYSARADDIDWLRDPDRGPGHVLRHALPGKKSTNNNNNNKRKSAVEKGYASYKAASHGLSATRLSDILPFPTGTLFPAGRLDSLTSGLLIVTNDGEFAQENAHPSRGKDKRYAAIVAGSESRISPFQALEKGKSIEASGAVLRVEAVRGFDEHNDWDLFFAGVPQPPRGSTEAYVGIDV